MWCSGKRLIYQSYLNWDVYSARFWLKEKECYFRRSQMFHFFLKKGVNKVKKLHFILPLNVVSIPVLLKLHSFYMVTVIKLSNLSKYRLVLIIFKRNSPENSINFFSKFWRCPCSWVFHRKHYGNISNIFIIY